jgi:hypothetical protein
VEEVAVEIVLFDLGGVLIEFRGVESMRELTGIESDDELDNERLLTTPTTCIFCRSPEGPFDKEDVWPKWVRNLIPVIGTVTRTDSYEQTGRRTDMHVREILDGVICRPRNNGWMSQWETERSS